MTYSDHSHTTTNTHLELTEKNKFIIFSFDDHTEILQLLETT